MDESWSGCPMLEKLPKSSANRCGLTPPNTTGCESLPVIPANENAQLNSLASYIPDWPTSIHPCLRPGVFCDETGVAELNLAMYQEADVIMPLVPPTTKRLTLNLLFGAWSGSTANLRRLNYLSLSGEIESVPTGLGDLSGLTYLEISNGNVKQLPDSIGNLTSLQHLNVRFNSLTRLPSSVGNLVNLQRLEVSGNDLTSVPDTLGNLTNLTVISLAGNMLTALPRTIGNLSNLERLDAGGNKLTALPDTLGNLTKLTNLALYANELTVFPTIVGRLPRLTELSLEWNQLQGDLSGPLRPLVQANVLTYLGLEGNGCLTASDQSVKAWLDNLAVDWDRGCSQDQFGATQGLRDELDRTGTREVPVGVRVADVLEPMA